MREHLGHEREPPLRGRPVAEPDRRVRARRLRSRKLCVERHAFPLSSGVLRCVTRGNAAHCRGSPHRVRNRPSRCSDRRESLLDRHTEHIPGSSSSREPRADALQGLGTTRRCPFCLEKAQTLERHGDAARKRLGERDVVCVERASGVAEDEQGVHATPLREDGRDHLGAEVEQRDPSARTRRDHGATRVVLGPDALARLDLTGDRDDLVVAMGDGQNLAGHGAAHVLHQAPVRDLARGELAQALQGVVGGRRREQNLGRAGDEPLGVVAATSLGDVSADPDEPAGVVGDDLRSRPQPAHRPVGEDDAELELVPGSTGASTLHRFVEGGPVVRVDQLPVLRVAGG